MPIPLNRKRDKEGPDLSESCDSITTKGSQLASWLNAECTSETKGSISKSHGENSLRFTCQNGHNFYLALATVNKLHTMLSTDVLTTTEAKLQLIEGQEWCTKCANFFKKTKEVANRKQMIVISGLYDTEISLRCYKSHRFSISYSKKLTYLSCLECTRLDKIA